MRNELVALTVALSCCSCPDSSVSDDARNSLPELTVRTQRYKPGAMAIRLSTDERLVVTASLQGKVGFHDAQTLAHKKTLDLGPLIKPQIDAYPRLTVIGDHAYAYYKLESEETFVFKIDLVKQQAVATWEVPRSTWQMNSYLNGSAEFEGVVALAGGKKAVAALGLEAKYPDPKYQKDVKAGIAPLFLDLETGTFSRELVTELNGLEIQQIYTAFDGHRLLGSAYYHQSDKPPYGPIQPHHGFILDLDTGELTRTATPFDFKNSWVDEKNRRVFLGSRPSDGWMVVDLDTGKTLHANASPVQSFIMQVVGVSGDRAVIVQTGGKAPSPVTLADVRSGQALARAWVDDQFPRAAVATTNGRRAYLSGFDSISTVDIPEPE